jgi:hypothetical protein
MTSRRAKSAYGQRLIKRWNIPVRQSRYRATGDFYMMLEHFPGALCDLNGFVVFGTIEDLLFARGVNVFDSHRITVPSGVSSLSGYKRALAGLEVRV